jgi:hypothetical protein
MFTLDVNPERCKLHTPMTPKDNGIKKLFFFTALCRKFKKQTAKESNVENSTTIRR